MIRGIAPVRAATAPPQRPARPARGGARVLRRPLPPRATSGGSESPDPADEPDFWEGEQWEGVGQAAKYFIPAITVLAALVGLYAQQAYNSDADTYLLSAPSETQGPALVRASDMTIIEDD
ncbi:unnamed protein product [Pedinophyceae sp. YPF-701]|nr:unnamed protein product [Pedinophyceae sp. YPF-701]